MALEKSILTPNFMAKNRYQAPCVQCHEIVPPNLGTLSKRGRTWLVTCDSCTGFTGSREIVCVRTSSGWTGHRNARGRCEDAPCCGCCTF